MRREVGHGHVYLRGRIWWVQFFVDGVRTRMSANTTDKTEALRFLRRKIKSSHAGRFRPEERVLRYEDLRTTLFADHITNGKKSIRMRGGQPTLDIMHIDAYFAGDRLNQITTPRIRQFSQLLQSKGLANGTVNRQLAMLRRGFKLLMEDGRIASSPHFPMLKEAAPRKGFLSPQDYQRLLARVPDYLRPVLALGFCGMRRGEVAKLEWRQVNFLENTITLDAEQTKTGESRIIPVTPELGAILRERRAGAGNFQLVCYRIDHQGNHVQIGDFRKAWEKACVASGLGEFTSVSDTEGKPVMSKPRPDRPGSAGKPKMRYTGLIFHDLRRSAVRNLVNSGVPEKDAMMISGHKTRSVFDRYKITSSDDVARAGRKLAEHYEKNSHNLATIECLSDEVKRSIN